MVRHPSLRAGFTLVELMIVMAILGLVTTMVSISFDALVPSERLNTSVRELAATIQATRVEAVSRNAEFWIQYDLKENRYRQATPFRRGGGLLLGLDAEESERYYGEWIKLKDGVAFASVTQAGEPLEAEEQAWVRFDPLGSASDHSVILTQPAYENFFTIEVLALTGLVRMHDGIYTREYPQDSDFE
ncbi:MAG: prepilin-type N-terminal cleavage/methylation domain-containing protein [bacterium]|nr:prepilin-type N-terminal cleavage/methylation domain-containing protein [bacterium]